MRLSESTSSTHMDKSEVELKLTPSSPGTTRSHMEYKETLCMYSTNKEDELNNSLSFEYFSRLEIVSRTVRADAS